MLLDNEAHSKVNLVEEGANHQTKTSDVLKSIRASLVIMHVMVSTYFVICPWSPFTIANNIGIHVSHAPRTSNPGIEKMKLCPTKQLETILQLYLSSFRVGVFVQSGTCMNYFNQAL
jgi:hypothetical protein